MSKYFKKIVIVIFFIVSTLSCTTIRKESLKEPVKRPLIACLGDSITYGQFIGNNSRSWPGRLARLGKGNFSVVNLGSCGATVSQKGDRPLREQIVWQRFEELRPDYLILMAGSNDSKKHNWISGEYFTEQYTDLLDALHMDREDILIVLSPPAVSPNLYGIRDRVIQNQIRKGTEKAAERRGITVIDASHIFAGADPFIDKVHPKAETYDKLARFLLSKLKEVYHSSLFPYN